MEIAAGDHGFVIGEDQRVVGHGVQLQLQHAAHMLERIAHRAVHLRHAAQAVGVLHPQALCRLQHGALLAAQDEVFRHQLLALMRPDLVHARVKGVELAQQRLQAQGRGGVRQLGCLQAVRQHQRADGAHRLGAIDQRQALLGLQAVDAKPRAFHRQLARQQLVLVLGLAQAQQHQRHVRQRRQVTGCAQRALLGHHRVDAGVEHHHQRLHQHRTDA